MRKYVCKYNVSCLRQVYASCSDVVNPTFCPVKLNKSGIFITEVEDRPSIFQTVALNRVILECKSDWLKVCKHSMFILF